MRVRNLSCPYCSKRTTREKMVNHIDYNHADQLPEGFTALRMTFHLANNKPIEYRRPCRVCKQPTEWDENKGRYNFLCNNPLCKEKYVAQMKANMGEKYGAYRPTATAEGLEKMLAARKISGKYKWSDGTVFDYTGSYELETLKFMDKGLELKSEDLMVPGPVLEYDFEGEKHLYITDIYYRPYNLIIEVKDGGSSVNKNKQYGLTRAKQIAKEKYVITKTNYNYIRLTDKDMGQLMAVLADLKYHLVENDPDRVIHVNENTAMAAIAPVVGFNPEKDVVVVNYIKKKTFVDDSDYAIADSPKFDTVYSRNRDGVLAKSDKSVLLGSYYTPYIVRGRRQEIVEALYNNKGKEIDKNFIYETAFGHPMYSKGQIQYEDCEEYTDYYQDLKDVSQIVSEATEEDISGFDKNFKKKTDKKFIFKDIYDSSINKYLKKDSHMKGIIEWYRKANRKGEVAINEEDDKIVGYIIVKDDGLMGPLYIAKKYRGYGASNTLFSDGVNKYHGNNLNVFKDNKVAINLYKKHGFKVKENNDKYLTMVKEAVLEESTRDSLEVSKPWFITAKDGSINACVSIRNYAKPMRARSSMLVIRQQNGKTYVFLKKNKDGSYSAPGGGWNKSETPMDAAIRETQEECRMNVDRVRYCGDLIEYYPDEIRDWVKENVPNKADWWWGYYSRIYVGFYASKFTGHINKEDLDDIGKEGKFYSFDDVVYSLPAPYADAIDKYLQGGGTNE